MNNEQLAMSNEQLGIQKSGVRLFLKILDWNLEKYQPDN